MSRRRVTLRDIADKAGVHFTTVGLALRGDPRVKPETVSLVRKVADEMGYQRDALLSALSSYRKSPDKRFAGMIGFLLTCEVEVHMDSNPRGRLIFDAAEAHAKSLGFGIEPLQVNKKGLTADRVTKILQARGIEGVIVPPVTEHSGPFENLDWSRFCTVALNYSVTSPALHRVCYNHMHGMKMHLEELRKLGYKRIGIALTHDMNVRTGWHWLGAYLAEQRDQPASSGVEPLLVSEVTKTMLMDWIRRERPDAVVVMESLQIEWMRSEGFKVPDDIGASLFSIEDEASGISGIHEQSDLLGVAAVDFVVALLQGGRRGVPRFPRYSMIDARWIAGSTLREQ